MAGPTCSGSFQLNDSRTTIEVAAPPQQVEGAVYQAFTVAGLRAVAGGGGMMYGEVPVGWTTWGEKVSAAIGFGPRGAVVTLTSECVMPTQLVDFGKNRKNLERVVEALRTMVPVL